MHRHDYLPAYCPVLLTPSAHTGSGVQAVVDMMSGAAVKMLRDSHADLSKTASNWMPVGPEVSTSMPAGKQPPGLAWTVPGRGHPVSAKSQVGPSSPMLKLASRPAPQCRSQSHENSLLIVVPSSALCPYARCSMAMCLVKRAGGQCHAIC